MSADAIGLARSVLGGREAWVVGGLPRDRALGRETDDIDLVLAEGVADAARELARAGRATAFELSDGFQTWRVVDRGHAWQIDLNPLRGGSLEADLALRDFTVNAVAEPLAGGAPIDPLGGLADLAAGRLRLVSQDALAADPLRTLRLVRLAVELGLEPDSDALAGAALHSRGLSGVAPERVFAELRRVIAADEAVRGVEMLLELGIAAAVLPELVALRGVEQNRFHHRDVEGHTLEVLAQTIGLARDPATVLGGELAGPVAALLAEPLADELTRGDALRWGAIFHDLAKPATRALLPDGRVSFIGHDVQGAALSREILTRLRTSERLRAHVGALTLHHLRLGFLVHHQPLSRRALYEYLSVSEPVTVDVTLLSVADRLATRGDGAERAIESHVRLARDVLPEALSWRETGPPQTLLRGDELAEELGLRPGPEVGRLLEELRAAQYAGEVSDREGALALVRARAAARS